VLQSAYYFTDGRTTVTQTALAAGLGEFDVHRAKVHLFDKGYIGAKVHRGSGEKARICIPGLTALLTIIAWVIVGAAISSITGIGAGFVAHVESLQP